MKCSKCGNELKSSDKFCTKCGASIEDSARTNIKIRKLNKLKKIHKILIVLFLVILLVIGDKVYKQIKLNLEIDAVVEKIENTDYSSYMKLDLEDFQAVVTKLDMLELMQAWIRKYEYIISNINLKISKLKEEKKDISKNDNKYNEIENQIEYYQICNKYLKMTLDDSIILKNVYIQFSKHKISEKKYNKYFEEYQEKVISYQNSVNTEIKEKGLEYLNDEPFIVDETENYDSNDTSKNSNNNSNTNTNNNNNNNNSDTNTSTNTINNSTVNTTQSIPNETNSVFYEKDKEETKNEKAMRLVKEYIGDSEELNNYYVIDIRSDGKYRVLAGKKDGTGTDKEYLVDINTGSVTDFHY